MAIKVQFEIGHSATVKTKRTPDGFTHDWELYVQGVNKADISAFVDKVVFNLHDSFPKPKRSFKEPPYVLKESGYAGFVLPIDIYFRNRDEPKRVTYSYDLDLQQEGPPVHRSEVKKHIFENPSEDFRQKLLKGGGIAVSGVVGGAIGADEKSLDMSLADGRNQMVGKPKLSSDASGASSSSKKHKQRTDDAKTNTFTDLFGTPITKSAPKYSPDPKTKTANGGASVPMAGALVGNNKSGGGKDKSNSAGAGAVTGTASSGSVGSGGKEKEKADKKDKHKQTSPHKDKLHEEKESKKKSDGKHDKKEEKKKDKKDKDKDRERNKEKASKRALSPKSATVAAPSPKRSSPVRSSSAASRDDPSVKASRPSESDKRASGSSSGKKSKKEKKSHDKDRDHKDKHRTESKEPVSVAANTSSPVTVAPQPAAIAAQPPPVAASKAPNASVASKPDLNSNKSQKVSEKESKKTDSVSKATDKEVSPLITDKKNSADKDKKSHKHKKKDKNKEKEKEKDKDQGSKKSAASKEKKDKKEKTAKNEATASSTTAAAGASKKSNTSAEAMVDIANDSGSTKSSTSSSSSKASKPSNSASSVPTPTNANNTGSTLTSGLLNNLGDNVYGNIAENLHTSSSNSNSEKAVAIQSSDSSNSSFLDLTATQPQPAAKVTTLFQTPANPQPTPPPTNATTPSSTPATVSSNSAIIQETPRSAQAADKRDHKAHRGADKSKTDKAAEKEDKKRRRNSTAVNTFVEPPLKQIKKDLNAKTAREKSQSPLLRAEDKQTFLPPPATTSSLAVQNTQVTALNLEYLSELQELHQKIMTLQDNEELQQVVEMIAATGRYEITSKTFDFDLCKLDRHTVQRLQDFFATSVS